MTAVASAGLGAALACGSAAAPARRRGCLRDGWPRGGRRQSRCGLEPRNPKPGPQNPKPKTSNPKPEKLKPGTRTRLASLSLRRSCALLKSESQNSKRGILNAKPSSVESTGSLPVVSISPLALSPFCLALTLSRSLALFLSSSLPLSLSPSLPFSLSPSLPLSLSPSLPLYLSLNAKPPSHRCGQQRCSGAGNDPSASSMEGDRSTKQPNPETRD